MQSGRTHVDDDTFLQKFLSEQPKPLSQIAQEIVESGSLDTLIRKRVESQLHFLSATGEVEHKRERVIALCELSEQTVAYYENPWLSFEECGGEERLQTTESTNGGIRRAKFSEPRSSSRKRK